MLHIIVHKSRGISSSYSGSDDAASQTLLASRPTSVKSTRESSKGLHITFASRKALASREARNCCLSECSNSCAFEKFCRTNELKNLLDVGE